MHSLYNHIQRWNTQKLYCVVLALLVATVALNIFINHIILGVSTDEWPGSAGYGILARNIAEHGLYSVNGEELTARRPPVYPYFLSLFYWAFGKYGPLGAYCGQIMLYIATGFLLVKLCQARFKDNVTTLLGCLLYTTHYYLGVESLWQRETMLFSFLLICFLFQLSDHLNWKVAIRWGVLAGLLYLTRPTGIVLPAVLFLGLLAYLKDHSPTSVLRHFVLCVAVFTITTLPWNAYVIKGFGGVGTVPTTSSPENLYKGHIDDFEKIFPWVDLDLYNPWMNQGVDHMTEVERSHHIKEEGWKFIFEDPVRAIKRGFIKICALYSPLRTPFGTGELVEDETGVHVKDFELYKAHLLLIPHALLIIFVGTYLIVKNWRRYTYTHQRFFFQLGLLLLMVTAMHFLAFGESRHRLPFDLCFILATAFALGQMMKNKRSAASGSPT